MTSDRPSKPPDSLQTIAGDQLAQRAKELIDSLFDGSFEPIRDGITRLRAALEAYSEVRAGGVVKDACDPQKVQINPPADASGSLQAEIKP